MKNDKNKGFSMVEVIIALAIFAILMIPIISSLISSMKNTTRAKTLQYRNEFTENIIEYAKETPLDKLTDSYFKSIGSYDVAVTSSLDNILQKIDPSGNIETTYDIYEIKGSVNLGTEHKKYSYCMEISNKPYAERELNDANYDNPNTKTLGVVEDLDYTKVALINGTIANYDKAVANTFLAKKIEILREHAPEKYEQYISSANQVDIFSGDTASRIIKVKVKGNKTDGYEVSCILSYHDNSNISLDGGVSIQNYLRDNIEYTPYTAKFDELPDIYLMYNVCVYNGSYAASDYIVFDLDEMDDTPDDKPPVHAFIVQTAETYSKSITEVINEANGHDPSNSATPPSADTNSLILDGSEIKHGFTDRNQVEIYLAATKNSKLKRADGTTLLNVYHNFDIDSKGDPIQPNSNKNKKNTKVQYKALDTLVLTNTKYQDLTDAFVGGLNDASQDNRGLFTIRVWMTEGDINDIDTEHTKPVITGTKGGNMS